MRIPQTPDRVKEAPVHALRAMFAGVGQVLLLPGRVLRRSGQVHAAPLSSGLSSGEVDTSAASGTSTLEAERAAVPAPRPAESETAPEQPKASNGAAATSDTDTAKADTAKAASTKKPSTTKTSTTKTSTAKAATAKTSTTKTSTAKPSTAKTGTVKAKATKAPAAKDSPADVLAAAKAEAPAVAQATAPVAAKAATPAATQAEAPATAQSATKPAGTTAGLPIPNYPDLTLASLRARMRGLDISQLGELLDYERSHDARENVITMFERRVAKLTEEGSAAS